MLSCINLGCVGLFLFGLVQVVLVCSYLYYVMLVSEREILTAD
jgi:hypothetical protein